MAIAAIASSLIAALHARTLKKIADTNRMTVSYRESAVPFCYLLTPHKAVGFSADLTDAVVDDVRKKLKMPGLQIAYIPVTRQNRNPLLVNDTYDLEGGSTTNTAARGQDVSFSMNLFYAGTRVLVKKASRIRGYADLAGKTVATAAGSTNENVIRKYAADHHLDIDVVPAKDYAAGPRMVESDRTAVLALDDVLLFGMRANAADPELLEVAGDALQVKPRGCMVRKGDPASGLSAARSRG
ncbi:ABC transporter substrate-binding protein [Burkholderia pseudomallei]|uniref:transporter substrate-binding domain-containing protein n=1 Tax=Burkholderia pseudomallei TaxID=28450 RepID=UPI00063504B6|nr:transporter substrate-binding domain-containing protein [Burkholderia pseudomallei]KKI73977.1 ABC transporter substrate-binding protein [Burkholderia pseudomallei]